MCLLNLPYPSLPFPTLSRLSSCLPRKAAASAVAPQAAATNAEFSGMKMVKRQDEDFIVMGGKGKKKGGGKKKVCG